MSALKVLGVTVGVVVTAVAVCYVVGRCIDQGIHWTFNSKPEEAAKEPDPTAAETVTDVVADVVVAAENLSETIKENVVNEADAMMEAIDAATDAVDERGPRIDKVDQLVKMGVHRTEASEERINEIELAYLALVDALHADKIKGTVWRGEAMAPMGADVVELRGRVMDTMTALRAPWTYFESENDGLVMAYQYTTHKRPIIILQLGGLQYVLASDANRFMTSIPDPASLGCDPHGYLLVALQCAMDSYGLDMKLSG